MARPVRSEPGGLLQQQEASSCGLNAEEGRPNVRSRTMSTSCRSATHPGVENQGQRTWGALFGDFQIEEVQKFIPGCRGLEFSAGQQQRWRGILEDQQTDLIVR